MLGLSRGGVFSVKMGLCERMVRIGVLGTGVKGAKSAHSNRARTDALSVRGGGGGGV